MKSILFAMLVACSSAMAQSQDTVRFRATGLTCALCSKAIHGALKADPSTRKIDPNLQTQQWVVVYKKGMFDKHRLIGQVESAGFGVSDIYLNDSLVYRKSRAAKPRK